MFWLALLALARAMGRGFIGAAFGYVPEFSLTDPLSVFVAVVGDVLRCSGWSVVLAAIALGRELRRPRPVAQPG